MKRLTEKVAAEHRVAELYERYMEGESFEVAKELGGIDVNSRGGEGAFKNRYGPDSTRAGIMRGIAEKVVGSGWEWRVIDTVTGPEFLILYYKA